MNPALASTTREPSTLSVSDGKASRSDSVRQRVGALAVSGVLDFRSLIAFSRFSNLSFLRLHILHLFFSRVRPIPAWPAFGLAGGPLQGLLMVQATKPAETCKQVFDISPPLSRQPAARRGLGRRAGGGGKGGERESPKPRLAPRAKLCGSFELNSLANF